MLRSFSIALFLLLLVSTLAQGQYYLFNRPEPAKIELKFAKHSIEAVPGKTIFNVIKIVNQSTNRQTFTLQFTIPSGWKIIGEEKQELTLAPLDSTLIPIRVAIGEKVRGDIGYSIIAALTDNRGNIIKNEYSFIKIPRRMEIAVKLLTRFRYLDQQTGHAPIQIRIDNKGNREEIVTLQLETDSYLGIETSRIQNFIKDITVPPYSDSTVTFDVYLNTKLSTSRETFKVNITAKTIDSTYRSTCWLRNLNHSLTNRIPESKKVLIAELFARGLFSSYSKPAYASILRGNILLHKKREIYYYYNNDNITPVEQLYRYNRMWAGYKSRKFHIRLGDINKSVESSLYGRGGMVSIKLNRFKVNAYATQRIQNPQNNFALKTEFSTRQNIGFMLGGVYSNTLDNTFNSKLGTFGLTFKLLKKIRMNLRGTYNALQFNTTSGSEEKKNAMGASVHLNYNTQRFNLSLRYKAGQRFLYSSYNGRSEFITHAIYLLNRKNQLNYFIIDNRNNPGIYRTFNTIYQPFTNLHKQLLTWGLRPNSRLYFFTGPGFQYNASDIFPVIRKGEDHFATMVFNYNVGIRYRGDQPGSSITGQIYSGFVNVSHRPTRFIDPTFTIPNTKNRFNYQYFSLNLRQPKWGLQAMYSNGPRTIYEQFSWYYSSRPTRLLRIMPYYDAFIYKDNVRLMVNVSYSNDLVSKSSYTNLTSQVFWYLPRNWQFRLLNVYTIQSRVTPTEAVERFSNMYFEANIRKEFGFQQPAIRFHTLKLVFFKDYNGNRIKNDNEPGIKNILISIQRIRDENNEYASFSSGELLSNQYGEVIFEDIPDGLYKLNYNSIGNEAGTFSKADIDLNIRLDKNQTYYIPFVEKNKIFGKIILNRSKLSGMGKIDVSNIRITATDSKGNTYSTLTDKHGQFTIFAPITDEYVVTVNNIFYENFDLRQNNFRVQFNGYKQFEVNFVFDEKIRRINFSTSAQSGNAGILQIRRTNLKGTIKDATSLTPLRARVNLINTRNNTIVTSIYSNPLTGNYNLSFLADDNYLLEILADDYWYFSEKLNLNQVTTFMNVTKDILLKPISIGSKLELNIPFDSDKSELGPTAVAELNRLLRILKANSNIKIEIQGHADDLEAINNPNIGEERAKVVARYLVENGFSNLQVRGFGNTKPISPNDTEENRALNRRVEIEVIGK